MNLICFGDSITHACEFSVPDQWPYILQRKLDESWPGRFRVFNRGISGNTTAQALDRLESDVIPLLPGIVFAQFGFNDAYVPEWSLLPRVSVSEFRRNLAEFHRVSCALGGQCVYIVNHPIASISEHQGNGKSFNENVAPYIEAVRDVASVLAAATIELPELMRSRRVDLQSFLDEDGLHLSTRGNHWYADMVFARLCELNDTGSLT